MEYRGMKEDERLVSVKPGQRQMMQTFKRFQNGIQMQQPEVIKKLLICRALKQIYLKFILMIQELLLSCLL